MSDFAFRAMAADLFQWLRRRSTEHRTQRDRPVRDDENRRSAEAAFQPFAQVRVPAAPKCTQLPKLMACGLLLVRAAALWRPSRPSGRPVQQSGQQAAPHGNIGGAMPCGAAPADRGDLDPPIRKRLRPQVSRGGQS